MPSSKMLPLILFSILLLIIKKSEQCGTSSTDAEYVSNPVFNMDISPPIGWTYFPSTPSVTSQAIWYFVGQSNTTTDAKTMADAQVTAAMLEAIAAANLPVSSVTITDDWQPIQVENPQTTTPTGSLYGKVEGGALVQTAPGVSSGSTLTYTAYTKALRVTVNGLGSTRFYWNIVQSTFLQKMTMNYHAQFTGTVTITNV